jgi:hypothetical protein
VDNISGATVYNGAFTNSQLGNGVQLPTGSYTVTYTWNSLTISQSWSEVHDVGNPISWTLQDQYLDWVLGSVNTITSNDNIETGNAISQNTLAQGELGWVSSNLTIKKLYPVFTGWVGNLGAWLIQTSVTKLEVIDDNGNPEVSIMMFGFGGPSYKYVTVYDENGSSLIPSYLSYNTGPFKIDLDASNNFNVYHNNLVNPIVSTPQAYAASDYKVKATAHGGTIFNTYTSFCGLPNSEQCAHLDYQLDGNYYVTTNGKLCFVYNEEYNDPDIEFNIYNNYGNVVATEADFLLPSLVHGENRIVLDFDDYDCANEGFYVLEVINDKKEKFYLRFYYKYHGYYTWFHGFLIQNNWLSPCFQSQIMQPDVTGP